MALSFHDDGPLPSNGTCSNSNSGSGTFVDVIYQEFLVCRLCSKKYRQPKTLSCQHTFCSDCIESHYEMDEQDRQYRFLLSYNRDLSCPICRTRTPVPSGGIRRLPDNFLVANLADVVNRRMSLSSGSGSAVPLCEICQRGSDASPRGGGGKDEGTGGDVRRRATVKCLDCVKLLCSGCAEMHKRTRVTSSHGLFPVSVERDVECKTHRSETLRFYCEPCESCICVLCTFHDHKDHDVTSLLDGLQRHRGQFETLLDGCRRQIDQLHDQLQLIDVCQRAMTSAEEYIRDSAIEAIAAVRRREKQLLEQLRLKIGERTLEFLSEKNSLADHLSNLESVFNLTSTMLKGSSVELLMVKKEMRQKLETVLSTKLEPTPANLSRDIEFLPGSDCFHDLHDSAPHNRKENVQDVDSQTEPLPATEDVSTDTSGRHVTTSQHSQTDVRDTGVVVVKATVVDPVFMETILTPSVPAAASAAAVGPGINRRLSVTNELLLNKEQQHSETESGTKSGAARKHLHLDRSFSVTSAEPPTPAASKRNTPTNFGPARPVKPPTQLVDRGTSMDVVELVDVGTVTQTSAVFDKETSTEYVMMVSKNVSTDNQGTEDKATSTGSDVTAAYRNLTTARRTVSVSRGTCTQKLMTSDRSTSPVAALRSSAAAVMLISNPGISAPRLSPSPASPTLAAAATSVSITTHKAMPSPHQVLQPQSHTPPMTTMMTSPTAPSTLSASSYAAKLMASLSPMTSSSMPQTPPAGAAAKPMTSCETRQPPLALTPPAVVVQPVVVTSPKSLSVVQGAMLVRPTVREGPPGGAVAAKPANVGQQQVFQKNNATLF